MIWALIIQKEIFFSGIKDLDFSLQGKSFETFTLLSQIFSDLRI